MDLKVFLGTFVFVNYHARCLLQFVMYLDIPYKNTSRSFFFYKGKGEEY